MEHRKSICLLKWRFVPIRHIERGGTSPDGEMESSGPWPVTNIDTPAGDALLDNPVHIGADGLGFRGCCSARAHRGPGYEAIPNGACATHNSARTCVVGHPDSSGLPLERGKVEETRLDDTRNYRYVYVSNLRQSSYVVAFLWKIHDLRFPQAKPFQDSKVLDINST